MLAIHMFLFYSYTFDLGSIEKFGVQVFLTLYFIASKKPQLVALHF
jgi:hypothetical protein